MFCTVGNIRACDLREAQEFSFTWLFFFFFMKKKKYEEYKSQNKSHILKLLVYHIKHILHSLEFSF